MSFVVLFITQFSVTLKCTECGYEIKSSNHHLSYLLHKDGLKVFSTMYQWLVTLLKL